MLASVNICVLSVMGAHPDGWTGPSYGGGGVTVPCLCRELVLLSAFFYFMVFSNSEFLSTSSMYIPGLSVWHCAADYAYCIYLWQFRHLSDRMPDCQQV
jgi:hypothetical protein